jgi:hypothetical protein
VSKLNSLEINVCADLLARAHNCASTEATRYYLNGVHVEPCSEGGVLLVATNGRVLVAIRDPKGSINGGASAIVSPSKKVLAACRKKSTKVRRVLIANSRLSLVEEPSSVELQIPFSVCDFQDKSVIEFQWRDVLIDGTFPNWYENIITEMMRPISECAPQSGFNIDELSKLKNALSAPYLANSMSVLGIDKTKAAWVFFTPGTSFIEGIGIVMPMIAEEIRKVPGWVKLKVGGDK